MDISLGPVSRRELWIFYYKHRARLWLSFLLPLAFFVAVSFVPTPRYRAEGVLIVRLGSEYVYQPEAGTNQNGPNSSIPFDPDEIFKSEVAILSSKDLHVKVIEAIGMDTLFPDLVHPEGLVAVMRAVTDFADHLPKMLGLVPDEPLTEERAQRRLLARAVEKFDKRFDILLEKESAVITVSYEHPDPEVAVHVLSTLLGMYFEKRRELYLEPRVERARAQMETTREHALQTEKAVDDYKREHRIYSLADQRRELLDQRSDLEKQALTITSPGLSRKIGAYNHELDRLDQEEREFNNLEREAQIASESYTLYSHKFDEAVAYEDLQRGREGSVRVIQSPRAPAEPRRLQWLIILAGVIISFLSMLATAAVTESFGSGFLTPESIRHALGLPVLAVFPLRSGS